MRVVSLLAAICSAVALPGAKAFEAPPAPASVAVLEVEGVINALTERYLLDGLDTAAREGRELVVVRLDTPGGLESSMRKMTAALLNAAVPTAVYVAPSGARAASAGMFLTLAGHVAAMAPGTNIGAAHPVGVGGRHDELVGEKIVNDAAALARAIAGTRGRNEDWAEQAVRNSVAVSAAEALELGVVDLLAENVDDLLARLDGREIRTAAGLVRLQTRTAAVDRRPMSWPERLLQTVTDPNLAYVLFSLGIIGIVAELYNPGLLVPGVLGAISLIVALVAFGNLPINWAAGVLLVFGFGLLIAEMATPGVGILAVGGVIAFVMGSLMLYTPPGPVSPAMPAMQVDRWLIAAVTLVVVAFALLVVRALLEAQRAPVATGTEALIGRPGLASTDLAPEGTVRLDSESWRAVTDNGTIRAGERVEVVGVEGVTLHVRKAS